jgi:RNA polymerase-binding transcription factor DksA
MNDDQVTEEPTAADDAPPVDLEGVAADLADVEIALARLASGTYFTDEETGEPLSDELLAAHPTARRNSA